jgi:hypothetical protein
MQNPSQMNGDNMDNIRTETSVTVSGKRGSRVSEGKN